MIAPPIQHAAWQALGTHHESAHELHLASDKIYAESILEADHLRRIMEEAQSIVSSALVAVPERDGGLTSPAPHELTVREAVDRWRNEGNPN